MVAGGIALQALARQGEGLASSEVWAEATFALLGLAMPIVGGLLAARRPHNAIGWLLLASALASGYSLFAHGWGYYGLVTHPGSLPAAEWPVWSLWVGNAAFVLPAVFVTLLFPDGRLPSSRWRPVAWAGAAGLAATIVGRATRPGPLPEFEPAPVANPAAIESLGDVPEALQRGGTYLLGVVVVAALASLVMRYRRADRRQRRQISFLATVAAGLFMVSALGNVLTGGRIEDNPVLAGLAGALILVGVPSAIAAAILWRGLYDIDRLVRRSVVYGVLWLLITAFYVGVAWTVGLTATDRFPLSLAVLLTVVVTVLFEPARRRLGRLADRWVFGRRPDSYELAAALSVAADVADDPTQLSRRLAELACRGVDAHWARVRLDGEDGPVIGRYPPSSELAESGENTEHEPAAVSVPLTHRDETLGVLECGARREGSYRTEDHRLLELLGREAALAAHNVRLSRSLAAQVDTVSRQADELAASRSRIVAAQEIEKRRIERNIHDGAQQELVALIAKVRLSRDLLGRDPTQVPRTLEEVQADANRVLRDVRELAQGIHPSLLADQGLVHATEDRAARLPLDIQVHADPRQRASRYDDAIEGAAYFVVSEALANVLKHADATWAAVHIGQNNGHLQIKVIDDGRGFVPMSATGTGLADLADRVEALGGELVVDSAPGRGTALRARLPVHPFSPAEEPDG